MRPDKRFAPMLSRRFLRIKVVKAVYAHLKSEAQSPIASEKNLTHSVDKAYDLYLQMLTVIVDVRDYALQRIEIAKAKKLPTAEDLNPNTRFVENAAVSQIASDRRLWDEVKKKGLGFSNYPELIKRLYNRMTESDYFKKYMSASENAYRDDVRLVASFYRNTVQDDELLESVLEEQSILWSDDLDFILVMILRTLEDFRARQAQMPLLPEFKSEDDERFYRDLFYRTVSEWDSYSAYIERFTSNWDVERIAFLDNVLMATALAELTGFPSIPVKVTLDEYIEIAKYYSTPGSGVFINGVLDKMVDALQEEGRIEKSGRGLLE